MPIDGLSLDLFDTLVDLHIERIPPFMCRGVVRRGTQGVLHAHLARHRLVSIEEVVTALEATDAAYRETDDHAAGRERSTNDRFAELCRRLGVAVPTLPDELTEAHMAQLRACVERLPHHAKLLRELARTVPIALCSNFSHATTARRVLADADLDSSLAAVVISEEQGYRKPRGEIFDAVCRALALPPDRVLHVGDRLQEDVGGARAAGLATAWLTRRVSDPEAERARHPTIVPDRVITDLADLMPLCDPGR